LYLCGGFVFNFNPGKPKELTLGILQVLRQSYHSVNEPNIHFFKRKEALEILRAS
jgi:hypothetical protein